MIPAGEMTAPQDGLRLLQLVWFLVAMLDVTLLIPPLSVFHTVKYVEWQWVIRRWH